MEVLKIQCIIQYLLNICLQRIFLTYLELKAKDDSSQKQYHIDSFPKTRNVILEYYMARLILPRLQYLLHNGNLPGPRFIG